MIQKIVNILQQMENIKGWKIEEKQLLGYQLFFIKQELDMNRSIDTNEYLITIYKTYKTNKKELQGEASCVIYPTMSEEQVKEKLEEAVFITSLSLNQPYELVKKQVDRPSIKEVSFGNKSLKDACFQIADSIFEADKFDHGYVNSSEIFVYYEKKHFLNSLGNEFNYSKSYAQMDIVVTWKEKKESEEIELHQFYEFDSLKNDYITKVVNNLLVEAKNRASAT